MSLLNEYERNGHCFVDKTRIPTGFHIILSINFEKKMLYNDNRHYNFSLRLVIIATSSFCGVFLFFCYGTTDGQRFQQYTRSFFSFMHHVSSHKYVSISYTYEIYTEDRRNPSRYYDG